jgi:hypothetical protein
VIGGAHKHIVFLSTQCIEFFANCGVCHLTFIMFIFLMKKS